MNVLFSMCSSSKNITIGSNALQPLIIYKTNNDYSVNVPISLNESQDKVIAYPAPGDLYLNGQPALPVKLRDGYWLDNRGIGVNTVFTEYTYNAYSKLNRAPLQEDLIKSVIDFDPFLEIYNCGNRQGTETLQQLNGIIAGKFAGCKKLK